LQCLARSTFPNARQRPSPAILKFGTANLNMFTIVRSFRCCHFALPIGEHLKARTAPIHATKIASDENLEASQGDRTHHAGPQNPPRQGKASRAVQAAGAGRIEIRRSRPVPRSHSQHGPNRAPALGKGSIGVKMSGYVSGCCWQPTWQGLARSEGQFGATLTFAARACVHDLGPHQIAHGR
jgi:hypothetical protein